MNTTKTIVKKLEFPVGEIVHFGSSGNWLAICGSAWFHITNYQPDVNCPKCLEKLKEMEFTTENI